MKNSIPLFVMLSCLLLQFNAKATYFNADSIYVYSSQYHTDSSNVYIVLKGWFPNGCGFNCTSVSMHGDTTLLKAGYYSLSTTESCQRLDTFFLGGYGVGLINIKLVVGSDALIACDSFYIMDTFNLEYNLLPSHIPSINFRGSSISPNPASSTLSIALDNPAPKTILQILSMEGRAVMHDIPATKTKTEIDIRALPAGLYFLELQGEGQRAVKKFVKE